MLWGNKAMLVNVRSVSYEESRWTLEAADRKSTEFEVDGLMGSGGSDRHIVVMVWIILWVVAVLYWWMWA